MLETAAVLFLLMIIFGFLGYCVIFVFYILKMLISFFFRIAYAALFFVSPIKPGVPESFYGTYKVRYLKWNDEYGRTYCTDDKDVTVKKMNFGFMGDKVYTDTHILLPGNNVWSESIFGSAASEGKVSYELHGWFTLCGSRIARHPNGRKLLFDIKMTKISNRILKRAFSCLREKNNSMS